MADVDELETRFSQQLRLVDSRALDFAVRRIETLKEENEQIKEKLAKAEVERGVLEVSKHLAKLAAGLVKPDFALASKLNQFARSTKNLDAFEAFVREQPSQVMGWRDENKYGASVLHAAANSGNLAACKMLIEKFQVSLWTVDLLGRTPLHLAASQQHLELCEYLTQKAEELGRSARGASAPVDMAGLTPAAISALASNPFNENQKENKTQFEAKRKSVKRHLHVLGDVSISPRQQRSESKLASIRGSVRKPLTGGGALSTQKARSGLRMVFTARSENDDDDEATGLVPYGSHLSNGWGVKMEDFLVVRENALQSGLSLFGVFDGHGGSFCADQCKKMLESDEGDSILGSLLQSPRANQQDLKLLAKSICEQLESRLSLLPEFELKQIQVNPSFGNEQAKFNWKCQDESGTTLLLALVTDQQYVVAHVGDSRACLVYKPGTTGLQDRAVTRDHKLTVADTDFVQSEISRIEQAKGFVVNNGTRVAVEMNESGTAAKASLGMTRSIGDFWAKINRDLAPDQQAVSPVPEVFTAELGAAYFLFMASDGVWDVMNEQQVGDFVRERFVEKTRRGMTEEQEILKEIASEICDKCLLELDSQDNMSVIIADLEKKPAPKEPQSILKVRRPVFDDDNDSPTAHSNGPQRDTGPGYLV